MSSDATIFQPCGIFLQESQAEKWMDPQNISNEENLVLKVYVEITGPGTCGLLLPVILPLQII